MTVIDSLDLSQINQDMHWAFNYLGTPWVQGGDGAAGYDCWTFFKMIQQRHFSIDVANYDYDADDFRAVAQLINSADERNKWVRIDALKHGCAVLMAHAKYPSHVGVGLDVDGGGVLHCVRGEGGVFSSLRNLQLSGWGRVEFYEYAGNR